MKRLGPELKMPDLKGLKDKGLTDMSAPAWLADLYFDLRERRLLLPIALVVVAIAAVPFLLGDSEVEAPPPLAEEIAAEEAATAVDASTLTVVEATPGLRNYKKRLKRRSPTDPFVPRYTGVPPQAQLESVGPGGGEEGPVSVSEATGGSEGGSASQPSSGSSPSPGGSGGAGSGGGSEGSTDSKPPRLIAFVVDVQISRSEDTADGGRKMSEPKVHRKVKPFTQLPGKKAPVVTTMGVNLRTATVMFLVSDEAVSLDGEFDCAARTPDGLCELLEVEPGFPFDVVHGPNKVRYRFKVTKVGAVWDGRVGDKRRSALEEKFGSAFDGRFGLLSP